MPDQEFTSQAYNAWWQTRLDLWSRLAESCEQATQSSAGEPDPEVVDWIGRHLSSLAPLERYWAYPGRTRFRRMKELYDHGRLNDLSTAVSAIQHRLATDLYRDGTAMDARANMTEADDAAVSRNGRPRPYFEVLVVGSLTRREEEDLRQSLRAWRRPEDTFIYELVTVASADEAFVALWVNSSIQACVVHRRFSRAVPSDLEVVKQFVNADVSKALSDAPTQQRIRLLAGQLHRIRPEVDLYLMTEVSVEEMAANLDEHFRRVFHTHEGALELHLSIMQGVQERYRTPFFNALRTYSRRPTGVFHALPISQGKSIVTSHWIRDMVDFYGLDIFLAETSATGGGLDSLLEPTGPLREAQQKAAETFGSRRTYFVTNGTSTANKIVGQALLAPGDIVLVDRNCHQSHHYGLILAGAHVTYLEAYPLHDYAMYGAVPIGEIKRKLLALRAAGKLDRVKMVMLTNCTFDGIVYDVERVMEECLAIKPDLVFLWDEAWFAFAAFHPVYRRRTAMYAAGELTRKFRSADYRRAYAEQMKDVGDDDESLLSHRLLPDPDKARVRVYASQSTHKTLTALRQGSMVHVFDQDFSGKVMETFHEAYMAHTSTSPNYQILASLDLGRRQVALEGYELVQRQLELAMRLRDAIDTHPLLRKYMRCLTTGDLIPEEYRPSGVRQPLRTGLRTMIDCWDRDEFVLDPCRITLFIGGTGINGATFKRAELMDRFAIQINKTSRNSVLFMTNIGTSRSSVSYLIEVLVSIARLLDQQVSEMSPAELKAHAETVTALSHSTVPLPDFSGFHPEFLEDSAPQTPEGDLRAAFYRAYDDAACAYMSADDIEWRITEGRPVVSATFVTPYPPGFPVLVPGQVFSREILDYLRNLDTPEVHGYRAEAGYRVYLPEHAKSDATDIIGVGDRIDAVVKNDGVDSSS